MPQKPKIVETPPAPPDWADYACLFLDEHMWTDVKLERRTFNNVEIDLLRNIFDACKTMYPISITIQNNYKQMKQISKNRFRISVQRFQKMVKSDLGVLPTSSPQ